ncbi:APC family permease [Fangia hongkongensis]|uniref:APC family permease n=1 Tax=Fangia hongkongensis TaxID=270495 RepID=UPI000376F5DB|nr:APC family permease [Fangia hongkongensis]MBK2126148.1 APC family permease [Fangia hongkongensis]
MKHKVGLFSAVAIPVTSMVGSGWLFSAQLNAQLAGNYAFIAWIGAAFIALIVGLCFAKLCALYPERGLNAKCVSISHGKDFGMVFAFAIWFGLLAMIPTEAQATVQYLSPFIHFTTLYEGASLTASGKLFAIIILAVYFAINYFGIKLLAKVNNVATVFKIAIPILTIITLLAAHFDTTNLDLAVNSYTAGSIKIALIGAGLVYAFNGFQVVASFASEIKDPEKTIPRAIIISIAITLALYMLLQLTFMTSLPHDVASKGWAALNFSSPLVNLTMLLGLNLLTILLIADSVVSPSITGLTYLGSCSRMLYAMADKGQMPKWIAKICPVHHLSKRSLTINFIIGIIILFNSSSWASLMVITTAFNVIGYMGAPLALSVLVRNSLRTKLATLFVFVCLALLMSTLPFDDFLLSNLVVTVMMVIYAALQYRQGSFNPYALLFVLFLWITMLVAASSLAVIAVACVFFVIMSHEKFLQRLEHTIVGFQGDTAKP